MRHAVPRTVISVEYTIEFGGDPQDLTVTQWGTADLEDLRRFNAELRSNPRYRGGLLILFEDSYLDLSRLSEAELEQIAAEIVEHEWGAPPRAVAIVTLSSQTRSGIREVVAHLGGSRSRRRIFTTRDAAIAWLREQRA
jgi:hypothetical protein